MNKPTFLSALAVLLLSASSVRATLLTADYESMLESWLGKGDQEFTNIFTMTGESTPSDFHEAADGKGATFSLASVVDLNDDFLGIIGGYYPRSWDASVRFFVYSTTDPSDRTAFIYNLTTSTIQRQNLVGEGDADYDSGKWQAYDVSRTGPTFGGGFDLGLGDTSLREGSSFNYSYGGTSYGTDIVGERSESVRTLFFIDELEVYTFASAKPPLAAVPEPATAILAISLGFVALVLIRGRFRSLRINGR